MYLLVIPSQKKKEKKEKKTSARPRSHTHILYNALSAPAHLTSAGLNETGVRKNGILIA